MQAPAGKDWIFRIAAARRFGLTCCRDGSSLSEEGGKPVRRALIPIVQASLLMLACGGPAPPPPPPPSAAPAAPSPTPEALEPAPEATPLPEDLAPMLAKPFRGDLDGMIERRVVRVLTVP